jgi:putative hydrolase of the HAD superfamily
MARFRAIVFDAGGTLIYPAVAVGETYARLARPHGVKLVPEATTEAFHQAMKTCSPRPKGTIPTNGDDRAWWKQVVKSSLGDIAFCSAPEFELFFEEAYLHYAKPEAWGIYPEVPEVIQALRDHDLDLVVLSNWDARLHAVLDGCGLGEFLPRRFISSELGWEKPDMAIYRHVADVLRLPERSLLSVGDDQRNDVEAPRKAGWDAVRIDRPKSDLWAVVRALSGSKKATRSL